MTRLLYLLPSLGIGAIAGLLAGLALSGALQPPTRASVPKVEQRNVLPVLPPCIQVVRRSPPMYRCWGQVYTLQAVGPPTPMPGVPAR
jgi:hypothetical protein